MLMEHPGVTEARRTLGFESINRLYPKEIMYYAKKVYVLRPTQAHADPIPE